MLKKFVLRVSVVSLGDDVTQGRAGGQKAS